MKILLIDDDQDLSTVFETALKNGGFEVVLAATGEEGLAKVKSENPNLILLDQILPDLKGNDVLKKLKEDGQTQNIPVALLSNFGQNELIQEAISQGAVDYILKYQIEPQDLVSKVTALLKGSETTVQSA
ncbi:MAG: response regulator [bacterium]|nr:response regulator [bacterium]